MERSDMNDSTHGRRDTAKAQAIPQPSQRTPIIAFLPPPSIYNAVVKYGAEKAEMPWWKTFLLSVLAGIYLAFACCLSYTIGGEVPQIKAANPGVQKLLLGAFGLPFGLALIVICGAELFTANTAFMSAAFYEGRAKWWQVLRNWVLSFLGNLAGSLFIVWLVDETVLFKTRAIDETLSGMMYAQSVAVNKTSARFGVIVVRGLLCNWLVTLAYWQATGAQDIIGKIAGVYFPVLAFEAIEFDHVVANMFLIPFGMKSGAPVSVGTYIGRSMIPTGIGNLIAGAFGVALPYALLYGSVPARIQSWIYAAKKGDGLPNFNKKGAAYADPSMHGASTHGSDTPSIPENGTIEAGKTQKGSQQRGPLGRGISKSDSANVMA